MWPIAAGSTAALGLFLATLVLPQPSCAQPPTFVSNMAFARAGPYLYFQGGRSQPVTGPATVSAQLVALPLNESWSTRSPPWKKLADGSASSDLLAVATFDNQSFVTLSPQGNTVNLATYNIQQGTWSYASVSAPEEMIGGIRPVVEPISGRVYIASRVNINTYDPRTGNWNYNVIPNNTLTQRVYGGAVYNSARYSIMYFGGYNLAGYEPDAYITEYTLSPPRWSIYNTTGDAPPTMADFCMAISEDGNTIAVFGGRYYTINRFKEPDVFSNLLYVLDVPRKVWTKAAPISLRAYTGCQIVGDHFLGWGGSDDKGVILPTQPPLVYDLTKKQWVDTYTPPAYYQTAPTNNTNNTNTNTNTSDTSSSKLGPILGGVFGCLAVIGVSVAIYFYLNSRSSSTDKPTERPTMLDSRHEERREEGREERRDERREDIAIPMQKENGIEYDLSKSSLDDHYTLPPPPFVPQQHGPQTYRGPQEYISPSSQGYLPGPQALISTTWSARDDKSEVNTDDYTQP